MQIEKFNPTVSELTQLVDLTKNIQEVDLRNKEQLENVKSHKKMLAEARINITKTGKELREEATAFSKAVIAKEKELIAIISPEEDRLKKIEEDAKVVAERDSRVASLPMRKDTLTAIADGIEISDDEILDMDDNNFLAYVNKRQFDKNEKIRIANEEKERELQAERDRIEKEKQRQADEERIRQEERDRIAKENEEKNKVVEEVQEEVAEAQPVETEDLGHKTLIQDLTNLLTLAKNFEFHDFKNTLYPVPKVTLRDTLLKLAQNVVDGQYDN